MYHLVARALPGRLLFIDWTEALHLWDALIRAFPDIEALCLMPDHIHLMLGHPDAAARLRTVKSGHTRWLAARRGAGTQLWGPSSIEALPDALHQRRTVRYIALNPCRAGLASDPLAWPLSLHRDQCGFGTGAPVLAPERHHAWVSADPTVDLTGTLLPRVRFDDFDVIAAKDAVSAVLRVPVDDVFLRGRARGLAVQTAWVHEQRSPSHLARAFGIGRSRVHALVADLPVRGRSIADPLLAACVRAVGDPRFGPLSPGDLRRLPGWGRYRNRR